MALKFWLVGSAHYGISGVSATKNADWSVLFEFNRAFQSLPHLLGRLSIPCDRGR